MSKKPNLRPAKKTIFTATAV